MHTISRCTDLGKWLHRVWVSLEQNNMAFLHLFTSFRPFPVLFLALVHSLFRLRLPALLCLLYLFLPQTLCPALYAARSSPVLPFQLLWRRTCSRSPRDRSIAASAGYCTLLGLR